MSTTNSPPPIDISGPSVMALAAHVANIDLTGNAEQPKPDEAPAPKVAQPHHCHAIGCRQVVPPELLMCRPHWTALPLGIRKRVLSSYTPGQTVNRARIRPEWLQAARQAIEYVLRLELQTLVQGVFKNLPGGYDPALLKIERIGMAVIAIRQEGKPPLVASLATGEIREVPEPSDADHGDAQPEVKPA